MADLDDFGAGIEPSGPADRAARSSGRRERAEPKRTPPPEGRSARASIKDLDLPPVELVTDERAFADLLEHLGSVPSIAIDTEADSFFSYKERVCLVQVSTPKGDWVVDPLAGFDFAPFGRVMADAARTKIFHDGEYDVLLMRREFDFRFANLFDTRVAAAALGYETVGLAAVLEQHFGIKLDKSQQLSDWSKRPLTSQQIAYARLDTHFLLRLREQLEELLAARNRTRIVEGECLRLEALDSPQREFEPDEFMRLKGARALDLVRMQVLRELFIARDEIARSRNHPPFKVLAHASLVDIARLCPRDERELDAVPGVSKKQTGRIGRTLLQAVRRGKELGPLERAPRLPAKDGTDRLDERGTELHERLKTLRKKFAEREGFDSSLALNRLTLLDLAEKSPTSAADLSGIEGLLAWQIESFGGEIVRAIAKFDADWKSGSIQPKRGQRRRRS